MTQKPHEWLNNPGDNRKTPDPDLEPETLVQVRFDQGIPTQYQDDSFYDDEGRVEDFYWQVDDELGDIVQYRVIGVAS